MDTLESILAFVDARRELPPPEVCRQIRENAGLSLDQMARASNAAKQSVYNWESGRNRPDAKHIHDYLDVLLTLAAR